MSNYDSQAFREAAGYALKEDLQHYAKLLLAAAEQREQLDQCRDALAGYAVLAKHEQDVQALLSAHERTVDTLTAEVAHQITFAKELAEEYAALEAISDTQREQIATLTADRDLLAKVNARVTDLLTAVTAERDAALAKIEKVRQLFEDFGETDDSFYNQGWLDAAITVSGILSQDEPA